MKITVSSNIRVTNPTQDLIDFCRNNLEVENPEYWRKVRLHKWTGNTPQTIALYKQDGHDLIIPYGCKDRVLELVGEDGILESAEIATSLKKATYENKEVPLYEFQKQAVDTMCKVSSGILQSPTGSGKTQMGIAIMTKLKMKSLWITHTKDLLEQSKNRALQYIDHKHIGTITEGKIQIGDGITFATIQTLAKIDLDELKNTWGLVIVDECHRVAGSPTKLTQFYTVLDKLSAHYKIGLSATVHRADGFIQTTKALLGDIRHTVTQEEVEAYTVPVTVKTISTGVQLSRECQNWDGTIDYQKFLNYITSNTIRNKFINRLINIEAEHHVLVLSDRVDHLHELIDNLPEELESKYVIITGKTDKKTREASIQAMRSGKKTIMFATYKLASEGLDIPCLDVLIMATPIKDYAKVIQSVGRLTRKCEGKNDATVYDLVDASIYTNNLYKKRKAHYSKAKLIIKE